MTLVSSTDVFRGPMRRLTLLPLVALSLAACDEEDSPIICALPSVSTTGSGPARTSIAAPPAVLVAVQDSSSGTNLTPGAAGAFVVGTFADSLRHGFDGRLEAWGPAGRYALVVQYPGYATWGMDDVQVPDGGCGPQTVTLTARLQRLGGL